MNGVLFETEYKAYKKRYSKNQLENRKIGRYFLKRFDSHEQKSLAALEDDFPEYDLLKCIRFLMRTYEK